MSELENFLEFMQWKADRCAETWQDANGEYACLGCVTFNFDEIAAFMSQNERMTDITSYDVAAVYMMKHIFSIVKGYSRRESLKGRFTDAHNYLYIMEWMYAHEPRPTEAPTAWPEEWANEADRVAANDAIGDHFPEPFMAA